MKYLIPFLVALLLLASAALAPAVDKSGVKPQVLSLPTGPGSIEGLGESFEPQLNTGVAPYSVKLTVPPGVHGHQPELVLQYNSGSGNSPFGIGWSLPLPLLQRQTDKGQPAYRDGDVFVYSNGEELVPLADGTWRCENEAAFMRFKRDGDGWEVRDKSGRIYRLGQYPSEGQPGRTSRIGKDGTEFDQTFKWYVDAFIDTNGNTIEYFYTAFADSPGQLYITEIRYNKNDTLFNSVTFDYETRSDTFSDYRGGFNMTTGRRAFRIQVRSQGALVREYRLAYDPTQTEILDPLAANAIPLAFSLLTAITQFDGSGAQNFLPPLRFGYTRMHTEDQDNPPLGNFPGPEDVDLNGNGIKDGPGVHAMRDAPQNVNFQDGNADFLDVNGDGLPDILHTVNGNHYYYLNLGNDRFGPQQSIGNSPGLALASSATTLADLDGDGLTDLVNKAGATSLVFYRNRGNGTWAPGVDYANPPPLNLSDPDIRLMDANFDKRIDLVLSKRNGWRFCFNSGDGDIDYPPFDNFPGPEDVDRDGNGLLDGGSWQCTGSVQENVPLGIVFSDPGTHLADMNGDRLQDVVWLQETSAYGIVVWFWPYKGGAAFAEPIVMAGEIPLGPTPIEDIHLADINADGLSDLVKIQSGQVTAWINLGNGQWSDPQVFNGTPTYDRHSTALRFADMNGNGTTDLVWIQASPDTPETRFQYLDFSGPAKPNQLKIIDNGLGRRITLQYRSSTSYYVEAREAGNPWQISSPVPVQVVSRVVTTSGLDVDGVPGKDQYSTDFAYRDAYYDGLEKEFRGFAFVKKIDRGAVDAPTRVTRLFFHTGGPDGVNNDGDGQVDERTATGGAEEEPLKGRLLKQEITTASGGADSPLGDGKNADDTVVFTRILNDWTMRRIHAPDGGSRGIPTMDQREVSFAFNRQTTVQHTERGSATPQQTLQTFAYDDFGNQTEAKHFGIVSASSDELFTFTDYIHDTDRWIVDRPKQQLQTAADGTRVAETRSYYDGLSYIGLALGAVERGNLTRQEGWVAGGIYINVKRHAYDAFGNVVGIMDGNGRPGDGANGHLIEIAYDPIFHTFPVKETMHVGGGNPDLIMTARYDFGFGVMTESTDFNGYITLYGYDSFGRPVAIVKPGDSFAFPTQSYTYRLADPERGLIYNYDAAGTLSLTSAPATASSVTTRTRENAGAPGTFDVIQYVDGLGRKLALVEEGETGFVVKEAVLFNNRRTVRDTFQPYRAISSAYQIPSMGNKTTVRYDATGREVLQINPPDADGALTQVTTLYFPLQHTVFDENTNETTSINDGLGRLIAVQEVNGTERYITRYTYNPLGSLTRITDAQNNVKLMDYDGLQRKTFMNDPDRGVMLYTYDDASNLIATIDAKGQRITYTYDGVNRLVSEDYHDEGLPLSANRSPDVAYHYDIPAGPIDLGDTTQGTAANTRGFLAWVQDLSGEEHTSYDARGRALWTVKRIPDPFTGTLVSFKSEMTYDAMDRVREMIYPDNDRVTYAYNQRSLLASISGGPTGHIIANINYTASGQLEQCEYGNGVVTQYGYDPRLRLASLATRKNSDPANPLLSYHYTFDGASNIVRIGDLRPETIVPGGDQRRNTQIFTYDDLYRLTGVQYVSGSIAYAYDRIGNMLRQTSGIDHRENGLSITNLGTITYGGSAGRFGRVGRNADAPPGPHALTGTNNDTDQRAYPYDDNGNMTTIDGMTLTWDVKDRLVAVENDRMRAEYIYDYTDQRIVKKVTTKTTAANPKPPVTTTTLYIDKYFEVREHNQPVKYVFQGDVRVARITGNLEASTARVQRLQVFKGWNLLSLAVQADDAVAQIGIGSNPMLPEAYRWNAQTQSYVAIGPGGALPAGSVFWLQALADVTLEVRGTYVDSPSIPITAGSYFLPAPGLEAIPLAQALPPEVERVWLYDSQTGRWSGRFAGHPAFLSDLPDFLTPGQALYIQATGNAELRMPDPAQRIRYYHQDHLGSSNVIADANGNLFEETVFYPFGHPRHQYHPVSNYPMPSENYLFTQKERDKESGLQYFEARYYAGHLGRFISVDPLADDLKPAWLPDPQALNHYAYTRNNPIIYADSTGKYWETAWDIASLAMGIKAIKNWDRNTSLGEKVLDVGGVVLDVAALATPIPGGAGAGLKATRLAGRVDDITDTSKALKRLPQDIGAPKKPDFFVTSEGTSVHASQARMKVELRREGVPSRPATLTAEAGEIFTVQTKHGPIDIRVMEGSTHHPRRSVFTRAGTNDPVLPSGEKFGGNVSKAERQTKSHIEQLP